MQTRIKLAALVALALGGCAMHREAAQQSEAVEYQRQQRDSAECANAGLLPGSDEFKACLARLEPAAAVH